jgi:hypothetical protein
MRGPLPAWWTRLFSRRREQRPPDEHVGLGMATDYLPLHRYLANRAADRVILTFREIEDLLGFQLPVSARRNARWWADDDLENASHSNAWLLARRSATPNLNAQSVLFERGFVPR